jgi:hypothetical protein
LNKSFVCNQFDGELCINKTVFCQINVFNRDLSEEGNFEIEMAYFESGKSTEDALEIKSDTFYISANSIYLFKTFINLQNEFAEKDINCFANSKEIPKKQICQ